MATIKKCRMRGWRTSRTEANQCAERLLSESNVKTAGEA